MGRFAGWTLGIVFALAISVAPAAAQSWSVGVHIGGGPVYGPYYGPMIGFNPHIKFFDGDRRGYLRCQFDKDQMRTDLQMVTTVSTPDADKYTFGSFVVEDATPGAQQIA